MTPAQIRQIADRIEKADAALRKAVDEIPGEAYAICGHIDAYRNPANAVYALRTNAGKFGGK
jgi:hypothetical protein